MSPETRIRLLHLLTVLQFGMFGAALEFEYVLATTPVRWSHPVLWQMVFMAFFLVLMRLWLYLAFGTLEHARSVKITYEAELAAEAASRLAREERDRFEERRRRDMHRLLYPNLYEDDDHHDRDDT